MIDYIVNYFVVMPVDVKLSLIGGLALLIVGTICERIAKKKYPETFD